VRRRGRIEPLSREELERLLEEEVARRVVGCGAAEDRGRVLGWTVGRGIELRGEVLCIHPQRELTSASVEGGIYSGPADPLSHTRTPHLLGSILLYYLLYYSLVLLERQVLWEEAVSLRLLDGFLRVGPLGLL